MGEAFHIVSIAIVFVIANTAPHIPFFFKKKLSFLSYLNTFAAGVFLAIGLMEILPEAAEDLKSLGQKTYDFPLAYFLAIVGFYIIFLCEEVVHYVYQRLFGSSAVDDDDDLMDLESPLGPSKNLSPVHTMPTNAADERHSPVKATGDQPSVSLSYKANKKNGEEEKNPMLPAIVLLIALSVHEILDGFSIGAMDDAWVLLSAAILDKTVESVALGTAFARANVNRRLFFIIIFIYSFMLPIGILIGMVASAADKTLAGILLALSAGSFFYISTCEIIPEEFGKKSKTQSLSSQIMKYAGLFGGTLVICLMTLWEEGLEGGSEMQDMD